jgi:hypothetical protein
MNAVLGGAILASNLASNEGRSSMLHWKTKLTYGALAALTALSAFVGGFDGWTW